MDCSACICVGVHRITASTSFQRQAVGQVGADVRDAVLVGHLLRLGEFAADQRHHLDAVDQLDRVQMLDAECAGTGSAQL